jgi:hypothetical protein
MSEETADPAPSRTDKRGALRRISILVGGTVVLIGASLLLVRLGLPFLPGFALDSTHTMEGFDPRVATFTVRDPITQQCRQVTFRNDTTELVETSGRCDGHPSANAATSANRLGVLRKSFTSE